MRTASHPAGANPDRHCAICQTELAPGESTTECPACSAPFHEDCWAEVGGCGVFGCSQVPATQKREDLEIPPGYWGQEHKPCPHCSRMILAAALRCRGCGAIFESAAPQSADAFVQGKVLDAKRSSLMSQARWIFCLSILPLTAPLGTLVAVAWYRSNRDALRRLPALYAGLGKLAIIIGGSVTLALVALTALYAAVRGG